MTNITGKFSHKQHPGCAQAETWCHQSNPKIKTHLANFM